MARQTRRTFLTQLLAVAAGVGLLPAARYYGEKGIKLHDKLVTAK